MPSTAHARESDRSSHLQLVLMDDDFPRVETHFRGELVERSPDEVAAMEALVQRAMAGAGYMLDDVEGHRHDILHPAPIRLVSHPDASFVLSSEELRTLQLILLACGAAKLDALEFIPTEA